MSFALLMGLSRPITWLQILRVNMLGQVGLATALAFEPPEADVMQRLPRPADEPILSGALLWRVTFVSALFFCGIFGFFRRTQAEGATLAESRIGPVDTLVVMETLDLDSVRRLRTPPVSLSGAKGTRPLPIGLAIVVTLQLVVTGSPFMEAFSDTRPVDFEHGAEILGIGMALFAIVELGKAVIARIGPRRYHASPASCGRVPALPR